MIDTDTFRTIKKLASGYDPNTGKQIGQNGIQIDQKISQALTRALTELRRKGANMVCELDDEEMELYKKLKEYRSRRANELGLPAFRIGPDETLAEIAMVKPQAVDELNRIYGLRQKRINDYGEDLISVVSEHVKSKDNQGA